jgi:PAS domain S-box-containing protein
MFHAINHLNFIGLVLNTEGIIIHANDFFYKSLLWKPDEVLSKDFFELLVPEPERKQRKQGYINALAQGGIFETKVRTILTREGDIRHIELNSSVFIDENDNTKALTIIGEDVTEKRRVAQALAESNAQLQDMIENTSDLMQSVDLHGRFLFVNRAWKEILGYEDVEIPTLRLDDVLHPDFAEETLLKLERIKKGEQMPDFETVFRKKNGRRVYLTGSVNCRYENDEPVAFRCIFHNATNKVRAERAQNLYHSIAQAVINSDSLDHFYELIHTELGKVVDVKNFFIAQYDPDSGFLFFPYYQDEYFDKGVHFTRRKLGNGLTEYAITSNKPLILTDDNIQQLADEKKIYLYGIVPKVMVCVPLRVDNRVTGIIGLKSYERQNKFDTRDLELLEFISGQIAVAIARKQAELQLNKQNARLDAIIQSSSHLIWSVNRRMLLTSFNQQYQELLLNRLGAAPQLNLSTEKMGFRMVSSENRRFLEETYKKAFRGEAQHVEIEVDAHQNFPKIWLEMYLNPIFLENGLIEEVSGIARDITEKKLGEMALQESESKFRDIFESFQDIYTRTNRDGRIVLVSPSVYERTGYLPEEVIGHRMAEFFVNGRETDRKIIQFLRQGDIFNFEVAIRSKNGEVRDYMLNIRVIRDTEGKHDGIEGVARDITELRASARELLKAKEEAERSLKVKERFLANMSHEIRTPMNGVIGMVDLLSETTLKPEQMDYVQTIKKSSETLLNILNDILDLSKIEAGKMELHEAPLVFKEVFKKLFALFGQTAQNKRNRLVLDFDETNLPAYIIADETRLLQILSNLTSNAIKFTENGTITVRVRSIDKNGKYRRLKIEVEDSGIGITPENLRLLFNAFSQVDNSSTKTFGGTGLGLAISKELCRMMKGEVGVRSTYGEGSTFWFTVELRETTISPLQAESAEESFNILGFFKEESPYVLLVDDNSVNRKVASEILLKAGCDVETADSGRKAIEMIQGNHFSGDRLYDVVLMDIQMPEMDGVETTQTLRKMKELLLPPVIAMTAYSMKEDRDRFLAAGMDDYVPKPIRAEVLIRKVAEWFNKKQVPEKQVVKSTGISPTNILPTKSEEKKEPVEVAVPLSRIDVQFVPIIDSTVVEQLKEMAGEEMVVSVFEDFEREATEQIASAWEGFRTGDVRRVQSELHTLKGNAGTLGVMRVYEVVKHIEGKAKHADVGGFEDEMAQLQEEFETFKEEYRK